MGNNNVLTLLIRKKSYLLIPCPFCGSRAEPDFYKDINTIRCSNENCDAQGPMRKTDINAIKAWNRRAE